MRAVTNYKYLRKELTSNEQTFQARATSGKSWVLQRYELHFVAAAWKFSSSNVFSVVNISDQLLESFYSISYRFSTRKWTSTFRTLIIDISAVFIRWKDIWSGFWYSRILHRPHLNLLQCNGMIYLKYVIINLTRLIREACIVCLVIPKRTEYHSYKSYFIIFAGLRIDDKTDGSPSIGEIFDTITSGNLNLSVSWSKYVFFLWFATNFFQS